MPKKDNQNTVNNNVDNVDTKVNNVTDNFDGKQVTQKNKTNQKTKKDF